MKDGKTRCNVASAESARTRRWYPALQAALVVDVVDCPFEVVADEEEDIEAEKVDDGVTEASELVFGATREPVSVPEMSERWPLVLRCIQDHLRDSHCSNVGSA